MRRASGLMLMATCLATLARADINPANDVKRHADGVVLMTKPGVLRLQVWSDRVIRVTFAPGGELPATKSLAVIGKPARGAWELRQTADAIIVRTGAIEARVDRASSAVSFHDRQGKAILLESPGGRRFEPTPVPDIEGTSARQDFALPADEHIYGLGQHQDGTWNYRGRKVHLQQKNMEVAVPVLMSSNGYGLLWDNAAITDVEVGTEGRETVLSWASEFGSAIDYYFMYGPSADEVVTSYRAMTGAAPMMPKWVWGFWQCKERYKTQKEMLEVVSEYRKRGVPIDGIIQDWQYWKMGAWGSHEFDPTRFEDPAEMARKLHEMNTHVLISVWPRFDVGTAHLEELEKAGAVYEPLFPNVFPRGQGKWYDAFNPEGRRIYFKQMSEKLSPLGFDGWWLDATEAELGGKWGEMRTLQTAAGPGAGVLNAYPLMTTTGVYEGQRAQTDRKRVCILTRSAYAGQQRNAAITWSGDIKGSWDVFAKQIPAGLNFSLCGIPYWNTDIGGFFGGKPSDPKYQELFTRWFQYGAFCPMFRVHGTGDGKELWRFDEPTQKTLESYIRLRYRMMPYIYSVSWHVTNDAGTMMRPLMMDFPDDPKALDVGDQYLFGPAVMVCPVRQAAATSRVVYLPGSAKCYDFWTGKSESGGRSVEAVAPIETMPLFVRAGAILPLGPDIQHVFEKAADPIELRVYGGADGSFTLYEDHGDNYDYEKGAYATIPLSWNDAAQTLTIGARKGDFPGMLKQRTFNVVFVSEGHGAGAGISPNPDHVVRYNGNEFVIRKNR